MLLRWERIFSSLKGRWEASRRTNNRAFARNRAIRREMRRCSWALARREAAFRNGSNRYYVGLCAVLASFVRDLASSRSIAPLSSLGFLSIISNRLPLVYKLWCVFLNLPDLNRTIALRKANSAASTLSCLNLEKSSLTGLKRLARFAVVAFSFPLVSPMFADAKNGFTSNGSDHCSAHNRNISDHDSSSSIIFKKTYIYSINTSQLFCEIYLRINKYLY